MFGESPCPTQEPAQNGAQASAQPTWQHCGAHMMHRPVEQWRNGRALMRLMRCHALGAHEVCSRSLFTAAFAPHSPRSRPELRRSIGPLGGASQAHRTRGRRGSARARAMARGRKRKWDDDARPHRPPNARACARLRAPACSKAGSSQSRLAGTCFVCTLDYVEASSEPNLKQGRRRPPPPHIALCARTLLR